jgi:hypothetical protein
MIIRYKCHCNPHEQMLTVRERAPGEDVVAFAIEYVGGEISKHHRSLSPLCMRAEMEYAKIPVSNEGVVGASNAPA